MFKQSNKLYETAIASINSYNRKQVQDITGSIKDALAFAASAGSFKVTMHITAATSVKQVYGVQYITDIPRYTQELIGVLIKPALISAGYLVEIEVGDDSVQMYNTTVTIHIVP
jgi:hypothetical protein